MKLGMSNHMYLSSVLVSYYYHQKNIDIYYSQIDKYIMKGLLI